MPEPPLHPTADYLPPGPSQAARDTTPPVGAPEADETTTLPPAAFSSSTPGGPPGPPTADAPRIAGYEVLGLLGVRHGGRVQGAPHRVAPRRGAEADPQRGPGRRQPAVTEFQRKLAVSHFDLGVVLVELGKPGEALTHYEKARANNQRLADAHPHVPDLQHELAQCHNNAGILLAQLGKPAEALQAHRKALAVRRQLADAHPTITSYQM